MKNRPAPEKYAPTKDMYDSTVKGHSAGRGFTKYTGIIFRRDGQSCNDADLAFARKHMQTPGQYCEISYEGDNLRLRGECDCSD